MLLLVQVTKDLTFSRADMESRAMMPGMFDPLFAKVIYAAARAADINLMISSRGLMFAMLPGLSTLLRKRTQPAFACQQLDLGLTTHIIRTHALRYEKHSVCWFRNYPSSIPTKTGSYHMYSL